MEPVEREKKGFRRADRRSRLSKVPQEETEVAESKAEPVTLVEMMVASL